MKVKHLTVSTADLGPAETDEIEKVRQRAVEAGGYLHIEVRVVAPEGASVVAGHWRVEPDGTKRWIEPHVRMEAE